MASAISPEFRATFRRCAAGDGTMTFARFMELALYDPAAGYYTGTRRRIGLSPETDFFTNTSLGSVFGELVVAAGRSLLEAAPPGGHTWVEIGAEGGGVIAGVAHPFAAARTIALGAPLDLPPRAIVFSNELFDARPFHRLIRHADAWRETGVALRDDGLCEVLLPALSPEVRPVADRLPAGSPEGYRIDLPLGAVDLIRRIAAVAWKGLFLAIDYGKSWRELAQDTPGGTARAYRRHRQSNDLLARPGEQDLTCHVCWDWLADELARAGFATPAVEPQEAFLVRHAAAALRRLTSAEAGRLSERKLGLMQLLHPANMGRKFQVLWARRL